MSFFSRTGLFGNKTQVPESEPTIPPPKEQVLTNPPAETTGTNKNKNPNANPEPTPKSSRSRIPSRKEELERDVLLHLHLTFVPKHRPQTI